MENNTNKIKAIQLNTRFADNSDLSNPTWTISPNLIGIEGFKLKNLLIPLSSYNIDNYNNAIKMYQNVSGTTTTNLITMTSQNYNSGNIASQLQTAMNSQGNLYMTCTFNTSSNLLSMTSSTGSFYFMNCSNDCYEELGLTVGTSAVSSLTAGNCINLSGVQVLNLQSNSLDGIQIPSLNKKLIASIPVDDSLTNIYSYYDDSADYIETNINDLSQISINLLDQKYRPIVQRSHWSLQLNLQTD